MTTSLNELDKQNSDISTSAAASAKEQSPILVPKVNAISVEPVDQGIPHLNAHKDYASSEWWLVYATVGLVIVTTSLAIYTARLFKATTKLSDGAEASALRQEAQTDKLIAVALASSKATEAASNISADALYAQRAYVSINGLGVEQLVDNNVVKGFRIRVHWVNSGTSDAREGSNYIVYSVLKDSVELGSIFSQSPVVLNDNLTVSPKTSGVFTNHPLSIVDVERIKSGGYKLYVLARFDYKDIFGHDHYVQNAFHFVLTADPFVLQPGAGFDHMILPQHNKSN